LTKRKNNLQFISALFILIGLVFLVSPFLIPLNLFRTPVYATASSETVWAGQNQITGSASYSIDGNSETSWTTNKIPASITFLLGGNYSVTAIHIYITGHVSSGITFTVDGETYEATADSTITLKNPLKTTAITLTNIRPKYSGDTWVEISEFSFLGEPVTPNTPIIPTPSSSPSSFPSSSSPFSPDLLLKIAGYGFIGIGIVIAAITFRRGR